LTFPLLWVKLVFIGLICQKPILLPNLFPVQNVITKFGSIPDFYNHLTWITARIFPDAWVESSRGIEFFSQVSYRMTEVTDKFSGIGVAMLAKVAGWQGAGKKQFIKQLWFTRTLLRAAGLGNWQAWQN
jgi:hypothetical protein